MNPLGCRVKVKLPVMPENKGVTLALHGAHCVQTAMNVKIRASLTLHETHCVHSSMNVRKMKFIS